MYLISAIDQKSYRNLLLSTHESASDALEGYAEATSTYDEVCIEASYEGFIDHDELAKRALSETAEAD